MNKYTIRPQDSELYEKAIIFLVLSYQKSGHNPKPVVFHSLRVAFYLLEKCYGANIIVGSILHDVLEDTEVSEDEIEKEFGAEVLNLIKAVSYQKEIKSFEKQYRDLFARAKEYGRDALIVKCADIKDNSFYIKLVADKKKREKLLEKLAYFLEISKSEIGSEVIWQDLYSRYNSIQNKNGF
jgi:guanosine-3',5'-bis(diphosphate) 3'-pyrophosphohydrolase